MKRSTSDKLRLDEALAHEEVLWSDSGEALVAAARRLLSAQLVVLRSDHLAVPVADREVLVQGVDDRRVRQRVARHPDHVVAEVVRVLEVHDVGLQVPEEPLEMDGQRRPVGQPSEEVVEVAELGVEQVLVRVSVDHRDRRVGMWAGCLGIGTPGAGEHHRLETRRLAQRLVEVARVHLDAADQEVGMVVAHE